MHESGSSVLPMILRITWRFYGQLILVLSKSTNRAMKGRHRHSYGSMMTWSMRCVSRLGMYEKKSHCRNYVQNPQQCASVICPCNVFLVISLVLPLHSFACLFHVSCQHCEWTPARKVVS